MRGIHRSPVNSPHKGQWRGALMFSLICVWINGWVNNREAGHLRRYRTHCDVSVMDTVHYMQKKRENQGCDNWQPSFFSTGYIGIIYDLSMQGLLKWLSHKEKNICLSNTINTGVVDALSTQGAMTSAAIGIIWPRIAIVDRHVRVKRSLCGRIQCFPPVTHTDISQNSAGCNYFSIHAPDTCFWWQSSDMKPERYGPCINRYLTIDRWAVLKNIEMSEAARYYIVR